MTVKTLTKEGCWKAILLACLLVIPLIFRTDTPDPVWSVRYFGLGLLVLVGLISVRKDRHSLFVGVPLMLQIAWGIFLLTGLIGIPLAHNAWEGIFDLVRWVVFTGLFYYLSYGFRTYEKALPLAMKALVGLSIVLGLVGAIQVLGWGLLFLPGSPSPPYATMWATNFYASAMLFLMPVSLAAVFWFRGAWQMAGIFSLGVGGWMLWVSHAAAPLLGLCILILLFAYFTLIAWLEKRFGKEGLPLPLRAGWRQMALLFAFGLVATLAFIVFQPDWEMVSRANLNTSSDSGVERLVLWKNSVEMLGQQPLTGVGGGNWKFHILEQGVSSQYQGFATRFFVRAHNDFIQALAEHGWVGGMAFLFFVLGGLYYGLRQYDRETDPKRRAGMGMAVAGILCWVVVACFSFPAERPFHTMMLFLYLAVGLSFLPDRPSRIKASGLAYYSLVVMAAIGMVVFFFMMGAEVRNKDVLDAKGDQDWRKVIEVAEAADQWPSVYDRHTFTPYAWYAGNAYLNLGEYAKAEQALERAAELHPWHPQVLSNYGAALLAVGKIDQGIQTLEELLKRFPDFHESRMNLTETYLSLGKKAEVERTLVYWERPGIPNRFLVYSQEVRKRLGVD